MKATTALQELLEELGKATFDKRVPVRLSEGGGSHAAMDGEYVQVDPAFPEKVSGSVDGPNQLRLVSDTHSHEMEHIRTSDLSSKERFMEEYPEAPQAAGAVLNILEDQWVDYKRVSRYPGHRRSRALKVKLVMEDDEFTPAMGDMDGSGAFIEGFKQLAFGGYVKGYADAPESVQDFLVEAEEYIDKARTCSSADLRERIAHDVMELLFDHIREDEEMPDPEDAGDMEDGDGRIPEDAAKEIDEAGEDADEQTGGADSPDIDPGDVDWPDPDDFDEPAEDEQDAEGGGDEDGTMDTDPGDDTDEGTGAGDGDDADEEDEADEGTGAGDGDEEDGAEEADEDPSSGDEPQGEDGEDAPAEDGDGQAGDEGGDEAGGGQQDARDEMEKRDVDEIHDKYDVDQPGDHTDLDRKRYERFKKKLAEFDTRIEERKRERDERIDDGIVYGTKSATLKEVAKSSGVIDDVEEKFSQYVTREAPRARDHGTRLDRRNAVRRVAGDYGETDLYEHHQPVETGDRCIGVTMDISGSMSSKMDEAKIAMAAVSKATEVIGDAFVSTCYTDDEYGYAAPGKYGRNNPKAGQPKDANGAEPSTLDLRLVTGPDEDFEWDHLDSFEAENNEPTAAGIDFTKAMMEETAAREHLMIVITDGKSYVTRDGRFTPTSEEPLHDCKQAADEARADGIPVIGIGIGDMDQECMDTSFGKNENMLTEIDTLAEDLIELYEQQLDSDAKR